MNHLEVHSAPNKYSNVFVFFIITESVYGINECCCSVGCRVFFYGHTCHNATNRHVFPPRTEPTLAFGLASDVASLCIYCGSELAPWVMSFAWIRVHCRPSKDGKSREKRSKNASYLHKFLLNTNLLQELKHGALHHGVILHALC